MKNKAIKREVCELIKKVALHILNNYVMLQIIQCYSMLLCYVAHSNTTQEVMTLSLLRTCKTLSSLALLPFYTLARPVKERETLIETPQTIPALKEWSASAGTYGVTAASRIVLDKASALQLQSTGLVFAADLQQLLGQEVPVVIGGKDESNPGDMLLTLDASNTELGTEGYVLAINERVVISARSEHGVFYGTRTILQLLTQSTTLAAGVARDWPDYAQRSLMVDVGRKYFSLDWLESHIRDLAYLKYNQFHLHLSDNFGFRLESELHPEIVSPEHYSKAEIRALIELAQRYHITIVPEIDMPGHMDAILKTYPHLQLTNAQGECRPGDIDLTKAESYRLMQDILDEFIPLFPGPYWHIGADEYLLFSEYERYPQLEAYARQRYGASATARDTYLGFVNWANEIVKAHGKITRVWNDGLHGATAITLANDMIYEHWCGFPGSLTPQEIVDQNLYIMNSNADQLYYVLRNDGGWRRQANAEDIYKNFETHIYHAQKTLEPRHPYKLGAKLHVWCDHPETQTQQEIAEGIMGSLRALAIKNWGLSQPADDYEGFITLMEQVGHAPGYNLSQAQDHAALTTLPAENLHISIAETPEE